MSRITINSNIAALQAQRRLGDNTADLRQSFERLSKGLRINHAKDDAAGLAVSETLKTDVRVYSQAARNLNDGLSLLSVADSALEQLSGIAISLSELAEQAANGVYSNTQRKALDAEAQSLSKEFLRIARSTSFNNISLLGGEIQDLRLQGGYGANGGISSGLGGAIGTGVFDLTVDALTSTGYSLASGDFNGDGVLDLAEGGVNELLIRLGNGDGTFGNAQTFVSTTGVTRETIASDFNGDGVLDIALGGASGINVFLGSSSGTFGTRISVNGSNDYPGLAAGDVNQDGIMDLVASNDGTNRAEVFLGTGNGQFSLRASFAAGIENEDLILADFNSDGVMDIGMSNYDGGSTGVSILTGTGNGSFGSAQTFGTYARMYDIRAGDVNNDGALDLMFGGDFPYTVGLLLGNGNGTFQAQRTFLASDDDRIVSLALADFNGDGFLDVISADDSDDAFMLYGNGNGTFKDFARISESSGYGEVIAADFNGDGVLDAAVNDRLFVLTQQTKSGVSPLVPFSLSTQADARQALPILRRKLSQISVQRGTIGAFQSRLIAAVNTLGTSTENFQTAYSRITDVDVAEESARLVRGQILQKASAAVLGQANVQPAVALTLLKPLRE